MVLDFLIKPSSYFGYKDIDRYLLILVDILPSAGNIII